MRSLIRSLTAFGKPLQRLRNTDLWKSEVESSCLVALACPISKLGNGKLVVSPDTVSGLFPELEEDPPDDLWLLESPAFIREPL